MCSGCPERLLSLPGIGEMQNWNGQSPEQTGLPPPALSWGLDKRMSSCPFRAQLLCDTILYFCGWAQENSLSVHQVISIQSHTGGQDGDNHQMRTLKHYSEVFPKSKVPLMAIFHYPVPTSSNASPRSCPYNFFAASEIRLMKSSILCPASSKHTCILVPALQWWFLLNLVIFNPLALAFSVTDSLATRQIQIYRYLNCEGNEATRL